MRTAYEILPSPLGPLFVAERDATPLAVQFVAGADVRKLAERASSDLVPGGIPPGRCDRIRSLLDAYFQGRAPAFDFPESLVGTDFELRVWRLLHAIPFGHVETYGAIAEKLGAPGAMRAVGRANHNNPIAILIPCHRVVGAAGALGGYGGGLWRKRWLLRHEGALLL